MTYKSFVSYYKKNRLKLNVLISLFISLIISVGCYLLNNCPYPYWDNLNQFCWSEYFVRNLFPEKIDRSDAMFINVSYDRQVVEYEYSNGNCVGHIDITNRDTLLKFLKIAERTNKYKYIFLDIRFENGINTPSDSALFAQISKMRDISYSRHSDILSKDSISFEKSAINDYYSTILSSFTRYQFLQDDEESIPLRIYKSITKGNPTIKRHGLFYTCNGKLCQNSPFMRIPEDFYKGHEVDGNQNYYDLGPMLLEVYDDEDWSIETKNKILVVGDFVNDLHDTYCGMQPGSYLVYLAYKELESNKHIVSWWFVLVMYVIYFIISLTILQGNIIWYKIKFIHKVKNKLITFLLNWVGFSLTLSIISVIAFVAFGNAYNIFFPSLIFSIMSIGKKLKQAVL